MPAFAPSLEKIMQIATGGWACAVLGSAVAHRVFTHLDAGARTTDEVAARASIHPRGAQALLDGLAGLGLVTLEAGGRYANGPDAAAFLVEGKPTYAGGFAQVMSADLGSWANLPAIVKAGTAEDRAAQPENPFWEQLVPSIAMLSVPTAELAAERLGIAGRGGCRWLDVGGGSGIWSAIWLGKNAAALGVQLDWPNVNRIAKGFVARFGVADRFRTIDGDFHVTPFGKAEYDLAVYSHIAHQETPESNVAIFKRFREALKPGGTLVVNDFVLDAERRGHPFAMLFTSNMLVFTKGGSAYRDVDYRAWLALAGFAKVEVVPTPTPATVILAS